MAITLQVPYPIADATHFDEAYHAATHMGLVAEHMGAHIQNTVATKGLAGGTDTPPAFHATATLVVADQAALDAGMAGAGPVLADIPDFTNAAPQMPFGQTYD